MYERRRSRNGAPLVIVPGSSGAMGVHAPGGRCTGRAFPRADVLAVRRTRLGTPVRPARGFDDFADQLEAVLDARGLSSAIVCGVSFGGLIALRFAARHPDRTLALVLVSTPGPGWHLNAVTTSTRVCRGSSVRCFWPRPRGACATNCTRRCPIRRNGVASRALSCGPFSRPRCRSPAWRRVPASSRRWMPRPSAAGSPARHWS